VDLPAWAQTVGGVVLATLAAYASTPVAIQAARRFAFYDQPRGYKAHSAPTPYLGGTAVIAAFVLVVLVAARDFSHTLPLIAGAAVLLVVGTIDDRRTVSPGLRVVVEFTIGALLAADGMGWQLGAGTALDAAVTGIWVVGVVNAFNLFDNMDGQASAMALVVAAGSAAMALVTGEVWVAAGSAALCGACLGFLPHNLSSPARIFLGDGGSMPIGFAVAVLVANAARHTDASALSLLVGFLMVGIPALDTTLVIISRRRRGIPLLTGGRDHLTHRTRQRLGSPRRVALALGSAQAVVSALVILGSRASAAVLVYVVLAFVVCAAAAIVALEEAISEPAAGGDAAAGEALAAPPWSQSQSWRRLIPDAGLSVVGLGAGLSPFFSGYYDDGVWLPIGLVLVVAAAMALIARPPRGSRPIVLAFAGTAGLGIWSLISMAWSDNAELAGAQANLWLVYAALLLLLIVLLSAGGRARTVLIAASAGIAIVAASVLVRMLGGDPGSVFDAGRIVSPLGYINGEGCVFAIAVWPALALAERRHPVAAGLGAAAAVCMTGLALMSESRGAAIATFAALIVALAFVPGVRRRLIAMGVVAAGTALAAGPAVRVYTIGGAAPLPASLVHHAAVAILLAAAGAGIAWLIIVATVDALSADGGHERTLRRLATVVAIAVVLAPLAVVAVRLPSLQRSARAQWHAFVNLSATGSSAQIQTRLFSGSGDRYDYWRVAWQTFTDDPLAGVGAGNYRQSYYLHRRTAEAIQNPHSIELQTLSELGLIGAVLLAAFVGGIALAAVRLRRTARHCAEARGVLVAAIGTTVVWFVDTSGDWMHLIPGVAAIALCAVAALLVPSGTGSSPGVPSVAAGPSAAGERPPRRMRMLLGAAGATLVLAIGGASLARSTLAHVYLSHAQSALQHDPARAISDSEKVLHIDGANLDAYYVKAAGQARFDHAAQARDTLLQAADHAPREFITWVLLGDLETRAHDLGAASGYYRHALALDPLEPGLPALVAHPESGLSGAS
jgi:UDP-GlcNAc:undecaprenyl-phosphate GlcNAc-1-phosphate transferase